MITDGPSEFIQECAAVRTCLACPARPGQGEGKVAGEISRTGVSFGCVFHLWTVIRCATELLSS